jgi:hypothetical protein
MNNMERKKEQETEPLKKFKYTLCIDLNDRYKNVNEIIFYISRYRKYTHSIKFDKLVTVKYAVEQAEEWLSGKITIDYYNSIKDDLFFEFDTAEQELEFIKNKNKGQLLSSCIYLEEAVIESRTLIIDCGS